MKKFGKEDKVYFWNELELKIQQGKICHTPTIDNPWYGIKGKTGAYHFPHYPSLISKEIDKRFKTACKRNINGGIKWHQKQIDKLQKAEENL